MADELRSIVEFLGSTRGDPAREAELVDLVRQILGGTMTGDTIDDAVDAVSRATPTQKKMLAAMLTQESEATALLERAASGAGRAAGRAATAGVRDISAEAGNLRAVITRLIGSGKGSANKLEALRRLPDSAMPKVLGDVFDNYATRAASASQRKLATALKEVFDEALVKGEFATGTWSPEAVDALLTGSNSAALKTLPQSVQTAYTDAYGRYELAESKARLSTTGTSWQGSVKDALRKYETTAAETATATAPSEGRVKYRAPTAAEKEQLLQWKKLRKAGKVPEIAARTAEQAINPVQQEMLSAVKGASTPGKEPLMKKLQHWLMGGAPEEVRSRGLMKALSKSPGAMMMLFAVPALLDQFLGISENRQQEAAAMDPVQQFAQLKASRIQNQRLMERLSRDPEAAQSLMQDYSTMLNEQSMSGPIPGQRVLGPSGGM